MKNSKVSDCQMIDIRRYSDTRGYLSVVENGIDIPFGIKRIYYLYMVPDVARGAHAHKELQQLLIATSGSVDVIMDDGQEKRTFHLDRPWKGLLISSGLWRDLENFSGISQDEFDKLEILIDEEAKMLTGLVVKRTNAPLNSKQ